MHQPGAMHWLPLCALCFVGCGAAGDVDSGPPAPVEEERIETSAVLGHGLTGFMPLSDGDELLVEQGYQGGFHLSVNARVAGFLGTAPTIVFHGELMSSGEEACHGVYENVRLVDDGDGWLRFPAGARCYVGDPTMVIMQGVRLFVEVSAGERVAKDSREIRAGRLIKPY